mmetsp:Transcript_30100/g.44009  ORF Transcript_30100/g.44009 Transcript_30100/m.44009 type:complete len:398 (+) Transcript_30100:258-1451(+)|eukprot:CAMPEP_0173087754 /NCGR_PEP_ID=MMETSP1102-20130122/24230_1 /TAXON_ID=49646 /ORGANISM="Geminigera sp., Strain Caron Lab Isolate" /LENGTH=397 /DNA_ID=CAMNT_0013969933 /DNA_START=181 /DNA_END=1374 /DNA_ORIENTATION=-
MQAVPDTQVADDFVTTPHGGQEWRQCQNFVEDFSVTTNGMGPPVSAVAAARSAAIHHYPPANFEPHVSHLAEFLWPGKAAHSHSCLQLGNGASELIDLVIRSCSTVGTWRPGPTVVQYEEYKRSAEASGFVRTSADDDSANLMCLVNPTNPTGDYMRVDALKCYIQNRCRRGTSVLVDESMQPWVGQNWREDSLVSQVEWRRKMSNEEGVNIFVIHSWTKIWSCTGIRLGSIISPTEAFMTRMKSKQVPWSVNCMALAFLTAACLDKEYLKTMWQVTTHWRSQQVYQINQRFPGWRCIGEPFLSWVWIEMPDEYTAEKAVQVAKLNGTPVRWGKPGYQLPRMIRIAVRNPEQSAQLFNGWQKAQIFTGFKSRVDSTCFESPANSTFASSPVPDIAAQ